MYYIETGVKGMRVFLDTTVFYNNYFLDSFPGRMLLDYAEETGQPVCISSIVLAEARHNLEKLLTEVDNNNRRAEKALRNRLSYSSVKQKVLDEYDQRYRQLVNIGAVEILEPNNEFLPEVVRRAIHRKKPFTEAKTEFRDCIIWLTYAAYANSEGEDDYVFITANTTDYLDSKKQNIHPDLRSD